MKHLIFAVLAATIFSTDAHAVREHGGRLQKPTWSCGQVDEEAGRIVIIDAAPTWVRIQSTTPEGEFYGELTVRETPFEREITPAIWCDQTDGDYHIRIQYRDGVVQILQSSPNARYAPVQLEEVK